MQAFHFLPAWALALAAPLALAGCGATDLQRGATGAATGAIIAEAAGGSATSGAAVGAVVGVFCDDVTPDLCR